MAMSVDKKLKNTEQQEAAVYLSVIRGKTEEKKRDVTVSELRAPSHRLHSYRESQLHNIHQTPDGHHQVAST
jgi:hypothetical protein